MLDDALVQQEISEFEQRANVSILVMLDDALVHGVTFSAYHSAFKSQSLLCWTML